MHIIKKETIQNILKSLELVPIIEDGFIAYSKNFLGWIEYHKDPRWGNRTYSNIKIFDIERKRFIIKTKKTYYSSIDISADGTSFVALENLSDGKSRLVFQNIISKWLVIKTKQIIASKKLIFRKLYLTPLNQEKTSKIKNLKSFHLQLKIKD